MNYAKNLEIKSTELYILSESGEKIGLMSKEQALEMAKEQELDLVEVSPHAKPPVAKIMSWSKFKYQQEKKRKESKAKRIEQKEMWFKSFIAEGDLTHKVKKVIEFLDKKSPVKITIKTKGRVARQQIENIKNEILSKLGEAIEQNIEPKYQGRDLTFIVRPTHNLKKEKNHENQNTQGNSKTV
ncbi:MAG: translation initiation factor IF-3 [bacterium]